mgnify:CR=1 FL=1
MNLAQHRLLKRKRIDTREIDYGGGMGRDITKPHIYIIWKSFDSEPHSFFSPFPHRRTLQKNATLSKVNKRLSQPPCRQPPPLGDPQR